MMLQDGAIDRGVNRESKNYFPKIPYFLRTCCILVVSSWISFGIVMNLANAFLIPAPDDAHLGHSTKNYSFRREFSAENALVLRYINTAFCYTCLGLTTIAYMIAAINAFIIRRRINPEGKKKTRKNIATITGWTKATTMMTITLINTPKGNSLKFNIISYINISM